MSRTPSNKQSERKPRILLIAEAANPLNVSVSLIGWLHSRALAEVADIHLVTESRNREAILETGLAESEFTSIDASAGHGLAWKLALFLRGGTNLGWTINSALYTLTYPYFEWKVWRQFGERLKRGEFDLVHRLTPLSPTNPSLLARKCGQHGIPFILGPLNGGLPWPKGFGDIRRKEKEWLGYVRDLYKILPGYRSTRKNARAIMVASGATWEQIPAQYHDKCIYIPENGIESGRFAQAVEHTHTLPLKVAFTGRLVPYKGADMVLEAAAPLIRDGKVVLDIIGDGTEMPRLKEFVAREKLGDGVKLDGWVEHTQVHKRLGQSDVFAFPSIREFGGAVVIEAMALGLVPIVVNYGGPGESVTNSTGFTVPLGTRAEIILSLRKVLNEMVADPGKLFAMSRRAKEHAIHYFTWEAKARQVLEVYRWVLGQRADKPDFGMPFHEVQAGINGVVQKDISSLVAAK
ncbi:MAG: group 1 glycosyl transferase [Pedosphaera sp.]|nr:group 1 glycosyl transferase [Pedosphaera sp.]